MNLKQVALIEAAAANALPSAFTELYDGWRLRYNQEVTRRANSVLAEQAGSLQLQEKLEYVEAWYENLGTKARFQLCPASEPKGLRDVLLDRGYQVHLGARIQVAAVSDVLKAKAKKEIRVELEPQFTKEWLGVYEICEAAPAHKAKVRQKMFEGLEPETAFALALVKEQVAAVGLGVCESDYTGIFNMATLPSMRQKGAASAVLLSLALWAQKRGAHTLYLQVAEENETAQKVYEKFGFQTLYAYQYFEQG